ncbi:helix-turn-helix domain-containing protein [Sodalinema gerasimenkoae]|uniref:helix-turn-helix domain-containing protein n=1 Tax=Sodalinema gerasimenkoae TaxID=2862348 RepID=UPI00135CB8B8|nr:transposase [Sodalinema gerasimenkoae]
MSAKKLSDADKQDIIERYRQPGETTSTLAQRYGVSNSTISRLLKSSFSAQEYDQLVQQKRSHRSGAGHGKSQRRKPILRDASSTPDSSPESAEVDSGEQLQLDLPNEVPNRRRRQSVSPSSPEETPSRETESPVELDTEDSSNEKPSKSSKPDDRSLATLTIEPLAKASIPKTCYLVVDRSSELISRPLREFNDLGEIPAAEIGSKTLPVFDNHRVARRFANRNQRVMKVPDSQMLQKTGSHLQAKGITRVFFDGQVYSL